MTRANSVSIQMIIQNDPNCPMRIDTRVLASAEAADLYLTATPARGVDVATQARELYERLRDEIRVAGARLLCERLFATLLTASSEMKDK